MLMVERNINLRENNNQVIFLFLVISFIISIAKEAASSTEKQKEKHTNKQKI